MQGRVERNDLLESFRRSKASKVEVGLLQMRILTMYAGKRAKGSVYLRRL